MDIKHMGIEHTDIETGINLSLTPTLEQCPSMVAEISEVAETFGSEPVHRAYLRSTDIIDWQHPTVLELANQLAANVRQCLRADQPHPKTSTPQSDDRDFLVEQKADEKKAIAQACFEWVRDEIRHSFDYRLNPTTHKASDVLHYRTGYCYAKSHLLAALLRANEIPSGFCYQRLSVDDTGAPYCLHGLNGLYLTDIGWYRVDPRGNKPSVNAQFTPPTEQLAFSLQFPEEADFQRVWADPLPIVIAVLQTHSTWDQVLANLPDIRLEEVSHLGLTH